MPAPYIGAGMVGGWAAGVGAVSPTAPTDIQEDDLGILICESANQAVSAPSRWTEVPDSPQGQGTAGAASGVRLTLFYRIIQVGDSAPTVADSGDHTVAQFIVFRGADIANPFHATVGATQSASTSVTLPSITTTIPYCGVLYFIATNKDANDSNIFSSWTFPSGLEDASGLNGRSTASGAGGGITFGGGIYAGSGTLGTGSVTQDSSNETCTIAVALTPRQQLLLP